MRILFAADLHIGKPPHVKWQIEAIHHISRLSRQYRCVAVIILGDVFDNRYRLPIDVAVDAQRAFKQLKSEVDRIIVVAGNHDCFNHDCSISSLALFDGLLDPIIGERSFKISGTRFHAISYRSDIQEASSAIQNSPECDYLLLHQQIRGAIYSNSTIAVGIDRAILDSCRARRILLGDIHTHQYIGDRIMYLGSVIELDFGERNSKHGIWIYDERTDAFKHISIPAPRHWLLTEEEFYAKQAEINFEIDVVRVITDNDSLREIHPRLQIMRPMSTTRTERTRIDKNSTSEQLVDSYLSYLSIVDDYKRAFGIALLNKHE